MTNSRLTNPAVFRWLGLVLVCVLCAGAQATTYYVATDGSDSNNGTTTTTPWKTIDKVNGYSFKSSVTSKFNAGDSILFKRGQIWREKLVIEKITGTSATSRITFGAYGTGNAPIICGSNAVTSWTQNSTNVWKATVAWVNPISLDEWDDDYSAPDLLFINGSRGTQETALANLNKAGEWFWASGVLYVYSTSAPTDVELPVRTRCVIGNWGSNADFITVQDIEMKNGLSHNLTIYPTNDSWVVRNITAHHCGRLDPASSNALDKNGIAVKQGNDHLITQCTIYESGGNNINVVDCSRMIIEKCVSYNGHHHCIDMKGGTSNATDNIIRYNTVYALPGFADQINGIALITDEEPNLTNTKVYGNVIYDITDSGVILAGSTLVNTQIFNNTVVNCTGHNFHLLDGSCNTTVKNNIGVTTSTAWCPSLRMDSATNKQIDYNCWLNMPSGSDVTQINTTSYATLATYKTASGFDAHSINVDPLFVNATNHDFHLQATSPCKDKGTAMGLTQDPDAVAIPQGSAVDIGAYEVSQTSDTTKPVITLLGTTPTVVSIGSTYTDAGATASDNVDGDITAKIVTSGTVNTATVGSYTITYNVSDTAGNAATAVTRTVTVGDTVKPVITLLGTTPVTVQFGATYTDAGATATDNVDGTITTKIVKTGTVNTAAVGAYTITYNVSDTAGNAATAVTRTINVVDTIKPVITLLGTTPVTVQFGAAYTDAGATATDNVDGTITTKIVKTGTVNVSAVGTYTITYSVSDTAGNAATAVTRTVNVVDTVKPVITLLGTTPVTAQFGAAYTDAGATATDNVDGTITTKIVKTGTVNVSAVGTYTITYNVSDTAGNAATAVIRTVNVVDTVKPVITLLGTTPVTVQVGATYTDAGATATDNVDGTITTKIVKSGTVNTATAGAYTITYNVSDTAGNAATPVTRTVNVGTSDTVKPVITLTGSSTVNVALGSTYTDAGATATDNVDGDITSRIVKSGTATTSTAGTYTLTYNVTDAAGNAATPVTRTVRVAAKPVITPKGTL